MTTATTDTPGAAAAGGSDARVEVDLDTVPGALLGLVLPADLLQAVADARAAGDAAEVTVLQLAVEWAHAHPYLPEAGGRPVRWRAPKFGRDADGTLTDGAPDFDATGADFDEEMDFGLPPVEWDAPAAFAAANNMSTAGGRSLIRDALTLRHRLPRTWSMVLAGACPVWPARKVAQAVLGKPADVAAYVDEIVAERAGRIGPVILDRIIDAAMLALYPEHREAEQLEKLDRCYVRLIDGLNHTGIAELLVRGEWTDLADFDAAVAQIAAALAVVIDADPDPVHGPYADLVGVTVDVRRARAVGILAHPDDALALLAHADQIIAAREDRSADDRADEAPRRRPPAPARKQIVLHLHLSDLAVLGLDPGCTDDAARAMLTQVVQAWCCRTDTAVTVRPILHADHDQFERTSDSYQPPAWMRELVIDRDRFCVFPHCTIPARLCDLDHIHPWEGGGSTCAANLAPLCRHHHHLKTHAGWTYRPLAPGIYLWADPHGRRYLHTPDGTRPIETRPPPGDP